MTLFGLIGYPLGHSASSVFFNDKFRKENLVDHNYTNFELRSVDALRSLINSNPGLKGLNVTIPHKTTVIPYLDQIDETARKIGAVNCISIKYGSGKITLKGYNSDVFGFRESLLPNLKKHHQQALIIGTGGSAKAVSFVLENLKIPHVFISRNPAGENQTDYAKMEELIPSHQLIINCTPVGMYPQVGDFPEIPYELLTKDHHLFDLIYNPPETAFLKFGHNFGASIQNGSEMFRLQALKSWEIWKNQSQ
ncbi:MAG: shikimate dehydrogenase [Bacteroidales bacterium]|nr:shikimate dehydrogenase [Bacteroidales bacterium]